MELLFLKVIPLTSINSRVFLQGLIPAVDHWPLTKESLQNERWVWTTFIRNLALKGYLLPGSVEDLGHQENSWIYSWPEEGKPVADYVWPSNFASECLNTFVNPIELQNIVNGCP